MFLLYAALTLGGLFFVRALVPETKGPSLETFRPSGMAGGRKPRDRPWQPMVEPDLGGGSRLIFAVVPTKEAEFVYDDPTPPVTKEGRHPDADHEHDDRREIRRESSKRDQQRRRRGRGMAGSGRYLAADGQGYSQGARSNARESHLSAYHRRGRVQCRKQNKGQKGCCRTDGMPDERVPRAGCFVLRGDGMDEDRWAKAWEEPRLLKGQAEAANDSCDDEGNPSGIQGGPPASFRELHTRIGYRQQLRMVCGCGSETLAPQNHLYAPPREFQLVAREAWPWGYVVTP